MCLNPRTRSSTFLLFIVPIMESYSNWIGLPSRGASKIYTYVDGSSRSFHDALIKKRIRLLLIINISIVLLHNDRVMDQ